ncbi:hypothetical protein BT69DRAFT_1277788 [Atractiella rhizophila]|nr:hypothetical protein BT69DRAFT_1277788 [Atractiella rhizophila]
MKAMTIVCLWICVPALRKTRPALAMAVFLDIQVGSVACLHVNPTIQVRILEGTYRHSFLLLQQVCRSRCKLSAIICQVL